MDQGAVANDAKMWRLSRAELERRWNLVRRYLAEQHLDALIVQGYEDKVGGAVKWLTDVPAGYPRTVIFHADDLMTEIDSGANGKIRKLDGADADHPGVGEAITTWAFQTAHFTSHLNARATVEVLRRRGYSRVALANRGMLPYGFVEGLTSGLRGTAEIIDATDFLDRCKAKKSAEEIALIRRTAATQDAVFAKLLDFIRPGMRDFEVNAFIDHELQLAGAERGTYIGRSAPLGQPAPFGYRHFQGRRTGAGDHLCVLLESNGLGGFWTELARIICFGKAPAALIDGVELCKAGQAETARLCVPGADPAAIATAYDAFMIAQGGVPEQRLYAHGMGYDMVERPLIREDETMSLEAGCCLAIHPTHPTRTMLAHICDNYLIELDGTGSFLHRTPKQIFEV